MDPKSYATHLQRNNYIWVLLFIIVFFLYLPFSLPLQVHTIRNPKKNPHNPATFTL